MKWIEIRFHGQSKSGKTSIWQVIPKDGSIPIGLIGWYPSWRKYCFFPNGNTVYEQDCLRDLANFCEQQTKNHKLNSKWSNTDAARARDSA